MRVSIQVKVGGFLAVLLILSFGIAGWIATQRTLTTVNLISGKFQRTLQKSGQAGAQNVFASLEAGARGTLERGEMQVFSGLLDDLGRTPGVEEIGMTDATGRIVFSSRAQRRQQNLETSYFRGAVVKGGELFQAEADNALVLTRAHLLAAECLRCHGGRRAGDLGGVLFVRYDLTDLRQAEAEVRLTAASALHQSILTGLATGTGGLVAACLGVYLLLGRLVRRPLNKLREVMRAMGQGELTRRLAMRTRQQDEIVETAGAMDDMAERLLGMVRRLRRSAGGLQGISGDVTEVSRRVDQSANQQAQRVVETTVALEKISDSAARIREEVDLLAGLAGESTSSSLEMASSIDEVAANAEKAARAVEEIGGSILQMAASIRQVAENAAVLKESADVTASSIAEMDSSIKEVEGNARQTAAITEGVRRDAEAGETSMAATLAGIREIGNASRITSEVIRSLSRKAQNIGAILSVIEEVTDQTSLLSLNAAIIAAQAGEHGRGFAVVAREIRELADRTGSSTREITQMVEGIQVETRQAVEAIARAEERVQEGERLSLQTGELLSRIFAGVQETSVQMAQIVAATTQQGAGSRLIREAMEKVSRLSGESAAATHEQDSGARLISQATEQMKELTAQVRLSTHEQSEAGRVIARAMENINEKVASIRGACGTQQEESARILNALGDIRTAAADNVEATRGLQDVVVTLGRESGMLQQEMGAFAIGEGEG